jgi:hypothetical protein
MEKESLIKMFLSSAKGNDSKLKYEQFLEAYNGGQCAMVLIKHVALTTKGDRLLRIQIHYTIFNKVVDETIWTHLLQLHNKLSSIQPTFREVNFIRFVYTKFCVFFVICSGWFYFILK